MEVSGIRFRKACMEDLEVINQLFMKAIIEMNRKEIPQWDELYPNKEVLSNDIEENQLFVGEIDSQICSVFVLNKEADKQYVNGDWKYPDSPFYIIHRLCVNPDFQNQGIGTRTLQYIENLLLKKGIEAIRLDAFSLNPYALKMYKSLGYNIVGEARWRKGKFYLMEKYII